MRQISEIVAQLLADEEGWASNPQDVWGIPTGYAAYDKLTGGLHNSELTIWGFPTSHGKTAFTMPVVFSVARHFIDLEFETGEPQGKILVVSPEMTDVSLIRRYISSKVGVSSRRLRRGKATEEERLLWREAAGLMRKYDNLVGIEAGDTVLIDDLVNAVAEMCRNCAKDGGVRLVVVDYLQLLESNAFSRYEKVTDISRKLKKLTTRHNIPVIALSQFKRKDYGPDEEPTRPYIHDLKESGDIENSADNIGIGWRKPVFRNESWDTGNEAQFWLDKHRDGPRGYFEMYFDAPLTRYEIDEGSLRIDGES